MITVCLISSLRHLSPQEMSFLRLNIKLWMLLGFFAIILDVVGSNLDKLVDVYSGGIGFLLDIIVNSSEEIGETLVIASSVILFYKRSVVSTSRLKNPQPFPL